MFRWGKGCFSWRLPRVAVVVVVFSSVHSHVFSCVLESRPAVSHGRGLLYFIDSDPWTGHGLLHLVTVTLDHGHCSLYFDTSLIASHGRCSLYFDTLERGFSRC